MGNNNSFYGERLMDWLKEVCIVETEDEVYYDAEGAAEEEVELFINNIKAQNDEEENELLEKLSFKTAEDFTTYLDEDEDGLCLAQKMVAAAYCTREGRFYAEQLPNLLRRTSRCGIMNKDRSNRYVSVPEACTGERNK